MGLRRVPKWEFRQPGHFSWRRFETDSLIFEVALRVSLRPCKLRVPFSYLPSDYFCPLCYARYRFKSANSQSGCHTFTLEATVNDDGSETLRPVGLFEPPRSHVGDSRGEVCGVSLAH